MSPTNFPMRLGVSHAAATPHIFMARVFEAFFSCTGTLGCVVCLAPQLFLLVYLHVNVGLPAAASPTQSSSRMSSPPLLLPINLDDCFFFNSLVVGLPYSSIFWQLWLFFVFKFTVVLFLFLQGGKVYLPMPPSWLAVQLGVII